MANYSEEENDKNLKDSKKKWGMSKFFLVLKIIGFPLLIAGIACLIISQISFGQFENNNFIVFATIGSLSCFLGLVCLMIGFVPTIQKYNIKMKKYIQDENKKDLKDIADTKADIVGGAVTKTTKNIKKGLKDNKFCKYCGAEIDPDSIFCNMCGKEQ